jgi:hypothetical protein
LQEWVHEYAGTLSGVSTYKARYLPLTLFNRGFFLFAEAEALREECDNIAPARSSDIPIFSAIFD